MNIVADRLNARRVPSRLSAGALLVSLGAAGCSGSVAPTMGIGEDASADVSNVDAADSQSDAVETRPDALDVVEEAVDAMEGAADIGTDAIADTLTDVPTSPEVCRAPNDGAPSDVSLPPAACSDASCSAGERCNPWTGRCQPTSMPLPPPGGDNGAACTSDVECRSNGGFGAGRLGVGVCESPGAGGWPGGYCRSYCNLCPDTTSVWEGTSLGRSNCPAGSLCLPVYYAQGAGYGACLRECRIDSDCRVADGYYCRHTIGARSYTNGYCAPDFCRSRGCTRSYECFC